VVLAWSAAHLRGHGFTLYDIQMLSPHLERLGAIEISADEYLERLEAALAPRG
jgi:leucyl/phenylalanyl-tRNA--protein transferase